MAYLEVGMWEILDVLRRVHRGESYAAIERIRSVNRVADSRKPGRYGSSGCSRSRARTAERKGLSASVR